MDEYKSLHVALCSINYRQQIDKFCSTAEEHLYAQARKNYERFSLELPEELYKPSKYIMFGSYDICFVSLIHDFEFAQKNFFSIPSDDLHFYDSKYQIITGIPTHEINKDILKSNKKHIAIINLKIKNGLLIGNGNKLLNKIVLHLEKKLTDSEAAKNYYPNNFIITQSFCWFELSITIFDDDLSKLFTTIASIRNIKLKDVFEDDNDLKEIIENSFYDLDKDHPLEGYQNKNIFSDTQSHMGIEKGYIDIIDVDTLPKTGESQDATSVDDYLSFLFEWQIKPGTFLKLKEILSNADIEVPNAHKHFLSGKYDFISEIINKNSLNTFIRIYNLIRDKKNNGKENDSDFKKIVRQVKSRPLIDTTKWVKSEKTMEYKISITEKLQKFLISNKSIENIDNDLKSLKLSRLLRKKIIKIFENYNNAIIEPVLFTFFIDFCIYIKKLEKIIKQFAINAEQNPEQVASLTTRLEEYINAFEDGYQARYLNSYNYEEINTFDLDFNSSIEQLLTAYNTLMIKLSHQYYGIENCGRIVLFNLNATHSTGIYANFYINHLLNPEFVYTVITKEILNSFLSKLKQDDDLKTEYDGLVVEINKSELQPYFNSLNEEKSNLELFKYIITDLIHYDSFLKVEENDDYESAFKKYNFWFWSYSLQTSLLYNTDGILNQREFQIQLMRILILTKIIFAKEFKNGVAIIQNSLLPELFTYWHRYFEDFEDRIEKSKSTLDAISGFQNRLIKRLEIKFNDKSNRSFKKYMSNFTDSENFSPRLLRRNWKNGEVMKCFLENGDNYFYYNDPFGGAFFDDLEAQKKYIRLRNEELRNIWNESLEYKKVLLEVELKELF